MNAIKIKLHPALWTCPKCKRTFERHGQSHSCRPFPLALHFENKPTGKVLYKKLRQVIKQAVGSYKVESLECCIHFVSTFTFAAVKIFKDKIRVDFSLNRNIKNNRFTHRTPMSAQRYLYCVNVVTQEDVDAELIEWVKEAHDKRRLKNSMYENK
jgi:Domain of unknown function (DUF5655)